MKEGWIIGIIVAIIVILFAGYLILIFYFPTGVKDELKNQTCEKTGGYCVYNNIPNGMLYTNPEVEIPENLMINDSDFEGYFERNSSTKTLNEAFGIDSEKWTCKNTGTNPVVINFFYMDCSQTEEAGCGYSREAIVCGDIYFIEQYSDVTGPVQYGPFSFLDEQNNQTLVGGCGGVYYIHWQECCTNWAIENNISIPLCAGNWTVENNACKWICSS